MNQRGRKSSAALSVVQGCGIAAITPPPGLSEAEYGVWQATVGSKPLDFFGMEHVPLLVEYCRHKCNADVIAGKLKEIDPVSMDTDDGLRRYEKLIGMHAKTTGVIRTLMTSMRLTHQSIYRADKAGMGPGKGRKPWQREPS